jgi:uncharacterized protein (TIGR02186 family)
MFKNFVMIFTLALIGLICVPSRQDASAITLELKPDEVLINATYNGTNVIVTGEIPRESEAAVLLMGNYEDVSLKKKGKALGLLWMNMGNVIIHNIPNVYLLYTDKSISELSSRQPADQKELEIGFQSLQKGASITSDFKGPENTDLLFEEFLKLKKSEGLYAAVENAVSYQPIDEAVKSFAASLTISPRLKHGQYEVRVFAIKEGVIIDKNSKLLEVKEVGFPAFISKMAYEQSALYGILAAVIAIAAGLIMGLIFSRNPRK